MKITHSGHKNIELLNNKRSSFVNKIILKEDYQKFSDNLTSFFMEFVIKSKKS